MLQTFSGTVRHIRKQLFSRSELEKAFEKANFLSQ